MARRLRLDPEHGIHHVYSRGTRQWVIFLDDVDRSRFLRRLATVCERYGIEVLAYCLMDNHFHLMVRCPVGGLSAALRDLKSVYAASYNRRHRYSGPVWQGRFGSRLATTEDDARNLVRYIHRNPLDIDRHAPLSHYPWSSHAEYVGLRRPKSWMNVQLVLDLFGGDRSTYRAMVETARPEDRVQNMVSISRGAASGTSPEPFGSLADILLAVAQTAGCDPVEVRPRMRNGLIGVAIVLALDHGGFLPAELAEPFGYSRSDNVERVARRARTRIADNPRLGEVLEGARRRLRRAA